METRIYQKENSKGPLKLLKESFNDLHTSFFLAKQLAKRDIKAQYRQSYFGILWAFITPLTTAFVWIILNKTGTIRLTDTGIAYPVYAFAGTLIWSVLTESINTPMASLRSAKSIISKINFPKEALILSGLFKLTFNSVIKFSLLLLFLVVFNVQVTLQLAMLPLLFLGIVIVGTTIGLFITPIGILYNDVSKIISLGLKLVMYVTPVVYAIPEKGWLKHLMEWNPLTPIIQVTRNAIVGLPIGDYSYYAIVLVVSSLLFFVALIFYRLSIPVLVERSGS